MFNELQKYICTTIKLKIIKKNVLLTLIHQNIEINALILSFTKTLIIKLARACIIPVRIAYLANKYKSKLYLAVPCKSWTMKLSVIKVTKNCIAHMFDS